MSPGWMSADRATPAAVRSQTAVHPIRDASTWVDASMGFGLAILWAYAHPFVGIEDDAKIYMGRALADLDPAGVGRDLMFANDGQSSFSLFRLAARTIDGTIGLSDTVALISIVNVTLWFAAIATFVRSFVEGRALVMVLAAVCVLSLSYAPWHLLAAAESVPIPRPIAEACVLFALAALCRERYWLCIACLLAGAMVHPIMAAPGFAVVLIVLGLRDRRWFAGAAAALALVAVAGLSGAPLASRLFATIDPVWKDILVHRNIYLFPHLWPLASFGLQATQAATILVGATFVPAPVRRLFHVAIAVGVLALAASLVFGDALDSLLVVQAQLWRAFWLPAVLASVAAGLCLWHLPSRGPVGQITLAALCLAWLSLADGPIGPPAALAAVALHRAGTRLDLDRKLVVAALGAVIVLGAIPLWSSARVLGIVLSRMPAEVTSGWTFAWRLGLLIVPVLLFVSAWRAWPRSVIIQIAAPTAVLATTVLLISHWDVRSPTRRDLDAARLKPDLAALLATRPGPVLWYGDEVWFWAHRGNWNGVTQGGALVFSRDLALTWRQRTREMVDHGLASGYWTGPWEHPASLQPLALDPAAIGGFCRLADAPAWIVAPLEPAAVVPAALDATIWDSRLAGRKYIAGTNDVRWAQEDRFAVIPCGDHGRG